MSVNFYLLVGASRGIKTRMTRAGSTYSLDKETVNLERIDKTAGFGPGVVIGEKVTGR